MRSVVFVFGLLSLCWAQNGRAPRPIYKMPVTSGQRVPLRVDQLLNHKAERFDLGSASMSSPALRTASQISFAWLANYQDTETVPSNPDIGDFQGDTLLSNGSENDPVCYNAYFDSLFQKRAWLVYSSSGNRATFFGNYLHGNPDPGDSILWYLGGGIAERYDFNIPEGDSIAIIGVASIILNNYWTVDATQNPTSSCSVTDSTNTVSYAVYDTVEVNYAAYYDQTVLIPGSYPGNEIARATKRYDQITIGYNLATQGTQCVQRITNRLENLDYIYLNQKVNIHDSASYYVAVEYTPYVPDIPGSINDTLFTLIGPAYDPGHPCTTGDTAYVGRNVVRWTGYDQNNDVFYSDWYDQYNVFSNGGYDLNFMLFPILGPADARTTTSLTPVVRSGKVEFGLPYPNPATDCVKLLVKAPATLTANLKLYDIDGRLALNLGNRTLTAGENTLSMDLPTTLRGGSYLLMVQTPVGNSSFLISVVR